MGTKEDLDSKVDFNAIIGNILRYGVTISSVLLVIGAVMIFAGDKSPNFPLVMSQLLKTDYGRPTLNFAKLASEAASLNPVFIVQLGLLILLATPIVRVAASILLFAAERDLTYVALTIFVLVVILFATFVVGPIEAA